MHVPAEKRLSEHPDLGQQDAQWPRHANSISVFAKSCLAVWQNVTLTVRAPAGSEHKIIIKDGVVVTPTLAASLCIGTGVKVGAGAVVVRDVPATPPLWATSPEWCASVRHPSDWRRTRPATIRFSSFLD